jgi:hypothetical protein
MYFGRHSAWLKYFTYQLVPVRQSKAVPLYFVHAMVALGGRENIALTNFVYLGTRWG